MQSLLLGIGDVIANAFSKVITEVVVPVFELIFEWVLSPIIRLILEITLALVCSYLYTFSCFLLQLIDFVEILFRSLAGLSPITASGMSMSLSLDGGSGDILVQLIRHPDIQSAFISMCVVGLFLLVVTTVFQIIKVEYTTEGAKNAKGPIFQKAFKGLANLMLLPLLVVFGIIFANQLLGLLDTATKGTGENPTISGLIFVSASTDAHYLENEVQWEMIPAPTDLMVIQGTFQVIANFVNDIKEYGLEGWTGKADADRGVANSNIEEIENNFINQAEGYKYYWINDVSSYYNYIRINYILILFGGVFALKCLFYTCFGMVIRLYKCAVLFIIAPAVIGMTPINEGGLGKWRTAFIGQVLSAYGTVLSLNLFFVVVRVLLSIEVSFQTAGTENGLGSGLMTLLLKCIFVLAGCLLIEKFSKELGGYFGADDAMGAGKEMSKQIGDAAMAGIQVAAMVGMGVATGGASLATSAGALAGKLGKGPQGVGKMAENKFIKDEKKKYNFSQMSSEEQKDTMEKINKAWKEEKGKRETTIERRKKGHFKQASATKDQLIRDKKTAQDKIDDTKTIISDSEQRIAEIDSELASGKPRLKSKKDLLSEKEELISKVNAGKRIIDEQEGVIKDADKAIFAQDEEMAPYLEKQTERKGKAGRKALSAVSTVYGLGMKGKESMPGFRYFKQFGDATKSGSKALGDPFEAAAASVEYMKGKKVQDAWHDMPGMKGLVDAQNALGAQEVMKQASKEMASSIDSMARNVESIMRDLAETINNYQDPNMKQQRMDSVYDHIRRSGANMDRQTFDDMISSGAGKSGRELAEAISIDAKQHLNINFDAKSITDALTRAMSKGALTPEALRKELQGLFANLGKDGEAALLKIIQDAIAKVGGQIGGK